MSLRLSLGLLNIQNIFFTILITWTSRSPIKELFEVRIIHVSFYIDFSVKTNIWRCICNIINLKVTTSIYYIINTSIILTSTITFLILPPPLLESTSTTPPIVVTSPVGSYITFWTSISPLSLILTSTPLLCSPLPLLLSSRSPPFQVSNCCWTNLHTIFVSISMRLLFSVINFSNCEN